jgi:predicted kinase
LARELSAEHLSSDVLRKELFGSATQEQGIDRGRYQPEARERVYQEMFRRAGELHQQRVSVVLDATFSTTANAQAAHDLAQDQRAVFLAIECRCPPEVARQRIAGRHTAGGDASEARPEVYEKQRSCWEEWPGAIPHLLVDSQQPLAVQLQAVMAELSRHW